MKNAETVFFCKENKQKKDKKYQSCYESTILSNRLSQNILNGEFSQRKVGKIALKINDNNSYF